MSSKLNIAIVGAGNIVEEYLKVINDLRKINVSYIYSKTEKNILKKKQKFKISKYSTSFKEFSDFLKFDKPDGIIIAVSVDQMYRIVKKILPFKIPLLIEKPPCLTLQELKSLVSISNKHKTPNMIGLNRRYYSSFQAVLKKIKNKKIDSIYIEGHENFWKNKHPAHIKKKWLYANSIHTIDLIFFFGSSFPMKSIIFKSKNNEYLNLSCSLLLKNGIFCNYITNWNNYGRWSVIINSRSHKYIFKPLEKGVKVLRSGKEIELKKSKFDEIYKPGFYNQVNAFIKLIIDRKNHWPDVNLSNLNPTYKFIYQLYNK